MDRLKSYWSKPFFKDVIKAINSGTVFIDDDEFIGTEDFLIRKSFLTGKQIKSITNTIVKAVNSKKKYIQNDKSSQKTMEIMESFSNQLMDSCKMLSQPFDFFNRVQLVNRKIIVRTEDLKYGVDFYTLLAVTYLYSNHESIYTGIYFDKDRYAGIVCSGNIVYVYFKILD